MRTPDALRGRAGAALVVIAVVCVAVAATFANLALLDAAEPETPLGQLRQLDSGAATLVAGTTDAPPPPTPGGSPIVARTTDGSPSETPATPSDAADRVRDGDDGSSYEEEVERERTVRMTSATTAKTVRMQSATTAKTVRMQSAMAARTVRTPSARPRTTATTSRTPTPTRPRRGSRGRRPDVGLGASVVSRLGEHACPRRPGAGAWRC